jgi:hypothetical protein
MAAQIPANSTNDQPWKHHGVSLPYHFGKKHSNDFGNMIDACKELNSCKHEIH